MDERNGSDEVDLVVGGAHADPVSSVDVSRFIAAYKQRPAYQKDLDEARKILAELGIDPAAYGMTDARSLLNHWHRCLSDLDGGRVPHQDATHAETERSSSE